MKRAGFTIIEVLVVTVIVAILAAVTLSIVMAAKRKTAQSACAANLSQIARAVLLYAEVNDGGLGHSDETVWLELVMPRAEGVMRCPELAEVQHHGPGRREDLGGYVQNQCLNRVLSNYESSRMVLLTESARFVSLQPNWVGPYQPYYLTGPDIYEMAKGSLFGQLTEELVPEGEFGAVRHDGGCLYAFVDGHVKWLRPTQLRLPVEGYGCSNLATIELEWKGPENGPYFSVPSENKRRN